ncbi:MAG: hypothetical protein ABI165_17165 [Bryobacteraceae bacterium]
MRHPIYLTYSLLLLLTVATAEIRGWGFTHVNQLKNVPKTVRDNPGSYRSHYGFYPRYFGGK